jgi:aspartyl-tRNA(Asn)/glutamyl-tRNA(Gln) amidotransferase subunit A
VTPLWERDAWEIADGVRAGQLTAAEVVEASLDRIARLDGPLRAFVCVDPGGARRAAAAVDAAVAAGRDPGPLAGVPLAVKDLEDAEGLPTQRGSLLFKGSAPVGADSLQVARLRAAGAVVVGKTSTPELGSLPFTWSPAFGATRSPWDPARTPGGSSGGSAAALSAGFAALATGSDGGGSIRIPASFCGLVGLKTSTGLIARGIRRGLAVPVSGAGPMARSVRDAARMLDQVTGLDPSDPLSVPRPVGSYEQALGDHALEGLRVAWSADLGGCACEPEVAALARAAASRLIDAAGMHEVEVPVSLPDGASAWATIWAVDSLAELREVWPSRADALTPVVAGTLSIAEALSAADVAGAGRLRYDVLCAVNDLFRRTDLLLTPTMPVVAYDAEGPTPLEIGGRLVEGPLSAICFVVPFNLTGNPAVSVPAGLAPGGLPVGLQIVGPRLSEARLLAAAHALERAQPWARLAPGWE